jgi:hypothetical protein
MQAARAIHAAESLRFTPAAAAALLAAAAPRRAPAASARTAAAKMKFRPCIDLHDGVVKQIVGSTLRDAAAPEAGATAASAASAPQPVTNFVATASAAEFAK